MSRPFSLFHGTSRMAALLPVLAALHGCATPQSLSEQMAPLYTRLAQLERQQNTDAHQNQEALAQIRKQLEQGEARSLVLANRIAAEGAAANTRLGTAETHMSHLASGQKHLAEVLEQAMLTTRQATDSALQRAEQTQAAQLAADQRLTQENHAQTSHLENMQVRLDALEKLQENRHNALNADLQKSSQGLMQELAQLRDAHRSTLSQWQSAQQEQQNTQKKALEQLEERSNTRNDTALKQNNAALATRLAQLEKRAADAQRMAEDALAAIGLGPRKILGRVVRSITLTDDKTLFPLNSPDLGEKDIAKLNALTDYIKTLDANYHLSIHGYTDGFGSDDYNYELGKARAEVVKIYLNEKRNIPLLRMSVISHGGIGSAPGGKSNRRIVIDVLQ